MASPGVARVAALEVLRSVRRGEFADRALARVGRDMEPRDHAWLMELTYGVLRLRGRLDAVLALAVRAGLESLDADVLDVLRVGLYQLREMDGVPAYAAVSESVELVRSAGHPRAAGLVNGVLQSIRRGGSGEDEGDAEAAADPVGWLERWGSHPRWLVERWVDRFGLADARRLVEQNNTRPELYLRPLGVPVSEAISRLEEAGIGAEPVPISPDSIRLVPPTRPADALAILPAVIQDPAASLVVTFAGFSATDTVLDLCSAPGGKAMAIASGSVFVVAADLSRARLERVRENAERSGLSSRVGMVVADGRTAPFVPCDGVLLDAPCTGTGTLRRHPDGKWRLSPASLEPLVRLQQDLLAEAATRVRPGGLLVYSTCSLEPEENEEQVEAFLDVNGDFAREATSATLNPSSLDARGDLRVVPHHHHVDGAYAARLRRRA